jgi:hypothetical protein
MQHTVFTLLLFYGIIDFSIPTEPGFVLSMSVYFSTAEPFRGFGATTDFIQNIFIMEVVKSRSMQ